ncbi:serine dehydratase [Endozoicomonas montiporae]|uniref:L-serine dehydratase n=2 Tax=Endozoicomonas montiporae TaxID=1027273 RepID=A0A081NA65_9GAMM|nr:L-serine ammonia-lyase [Endozoicomonas montiporae]AMO56981.1 L-serine dehydratase [Endozoicomonas montiporae CL-33]KEQ15338.1 serine dehydratase [Endozoicomonas montiporae]
MGLSIFELFKIGVGPSSSHTVGPMLAANRFLAELSEKQLMNQIASVRIDLFGSLAMTGSGHATDTAVLLGLLGEQPDRLDPDKAPALLKTLADSGQILLAGQYPVAFFKEQHLKFHFGQSLPAHPNGMTLSVKDHAGMVLYSNNYYSVGGGFVLDEQEASTKADATLAPRTIPYPFDNAAELLQRCQESNLTIAGLVMANEHHLARHQNIEQEVLRIWEVMEQCIDRGCSQDGVLPGGLNVARRAHDLYQKLLNREDHQKDQLELMDWVSLFALAVNEENAVGGRVVTAPTNGAAGVIPAVLAYYVRFVECSDQQGIITFIATAAAIGMLYKKNASISAAEVGCQGEIGVACSMAAGGLCAVLGGSPLQIENAAEIGMEHNLGLTCDPIGGLVQVPCIERNTMGAVKAINAARLALSGTGEHRVSLDDVIETMRQTGLDMQDKYKETAMGGLAVNVVMC